MLNLIFAGRICKDAELRTINSNEYYTVRVAADNGKNTEATFLSINYRKFGQTDLRDFLVKGAVVSASGRPSVSVYKDKADITLWADTLKIEAFAPKPEAKPKAEQAAETDDIPF